VIKNIPPVVTSFTLWQGATQLTPQVPPNDYYLEGSQAANALTLKAVANDAADGGSVVSYTFYMNGAPISGCVAIATAVCNLPALLTSASKYSFIVAATDNLGSVGASASPLLLTLNNPPTVTMTALVSPLTEFPALLRATAADPQNNLASVRFYAQLGANPALLVATATPSSQTGTNNASAMWQCPVDGTYSLYAVAVDAQGGSTQSNVLTGIVVTNQGLKNCSFETPALSVSPFACSGASCTGANWTFNSNSGIAANGAVATYCASTNAPDGTQAAYLRGNATAANRGKFSQTFSVPKGDYKVEFRAVRDGTPQDVVVRGLGGSQMGPPISVGAPVAGSPLTYGSVYSTYARQFSAPDDQYVLEFETQATTPNLMCIDDVKLVRVGSRPVVAVTVSGLNAAQLTSGYYTASQVVDVTITAYDFDGGNTITSLDGFLVLNDPVNGYVETPLSSSPYNGTCGSIVVNGTSASRTCTGVQLAGRVAPYTFWGKASDGTYLGEGGAMSTVSVDRPPTVTVPTLSKTALRQGESVNVTFTATELDGDDLSGSLTCASGANSIVVAVPVPIASGTAKTFPLVIPTTQAPGTYSCTLTVTDGRLAQSAVTVASTTLALTVNPAPVVTLLSPTNGQAFTAGPAGTPVALSARVNNTDGDSTSLASFELSLGANTSNWSTIPYASQPSLTAETVINGIWSTTWLASLSVDTEYSIRACGLDSYGVKACSASVNVVVPKRVNTAPQLSISSANVVGSQIVVRVVATDAEQGTLNYAAQLSNGTVLTYANGQFSGPVPVPGIYSVTVNVSDGYLTTTAQTIISVSDAVAGESVSVLVETNRTFGSVGGSFGVSDGGIATYSVPIQVPPGTNGLQPNLALNYSSQGGYGMLGVGWSLGGLSMITRCPRTVAQDGYREPINYDNDANNDEYCYGGQRLLRVGGLVDAGVATSTLVAGGNSYTVLENVVRQVFRTEVDAYSRITGYYGQTVWSSSPGIPAKAPLADGVSRFEVETREGNILHFSRRWKPVSPGYELCPAPGNDPTTCQRQNAGSLVKFYVLDQVTDRAGNRMEIDYAGTNVSDWVTVNALAALRGGPSYPPTEIYPTTIRYAFNGASTSYASVSFQYEQISANGQARLFDGGAGETVLTQKLVGITTNDSDAGLVKRYKLSYSSASGASVSESSKRERLHRIFECYGPLDDTCLPPTEFVWQGEQLAHMNGDGSGVFSQGFSGNHGDFRFDQDNGIVAPVRGNGRSQWARVGSHIGSSVYRVWLCEISGTEAFGCESQYVQVNLSSSSKKDIIWADVNGDGKADLVIRELTGSGNDFQGKFTTCLASATGTGFSLNSGAPTPCATRSLGNGNNSIIYGDFNGDGRIDLAYVFNPAAAPSDTRMDFYFGQTDGSFSAGQTQTVVGHPDAQIIWNDATPRSRFVVADFNGDGLADIAEKLLGDRWRICFSRLARSANPDQPTWYLDCPQDGAETLAASGTATPKPRAGQEMTCSVPDAKLAPGQSVDLQLRMYYSAQGSPSPFTLSTRLAQFGASANCTTSSQIVGAVVTDNQPAASCTDTGGRVLNLTTQTQILQPPYEVVINDTISHWYNAVDYTLRLSNPVGGAAIGSTITWKTVLPPGVDAVPINGSGLGATGQATSFVAPSGVVCTRDGPQSVAAVPGKVDETVFAMDVNGDGIADLVAPEDESRVESITDPLGGKWRVCVSTGDGAFARFRAQGEVQSTCRTQTLLRAKRDKILRGDFNGDGREDLLSWSPADFQNQWVVCLAAGDSATSNSGAGFGFDACRPIAWQSPATTPIDKHVRVGDFNGDGRTDISFEAQNGAGYTIAVGMANGETPDLVKEVKTGLSATTAIQYSPITKDSVYSAAGVDADLTSKEVHARSPMYVVRRVDADNGVGGTFSTEYFYRGIRGSTNGRGMLGFAERTVKDLTGGFTTTSKFHNRASAWQLAGRSYESQKSVDVAGTLHLVNESKTTYHVRSKPVSTTTLYDVLPFEVTVSAWDLVGTGPTRVRKLMPVTTTTSALTDYDSYGNALRSVVSTTDGHTKTTDSTFDNIVTDAAQESLVPGDWLLGRLRTVAVKHQKTGAADITRRSEFKYYGLDLTPCLGGIRGSLCEEILEPAAETDATTQVAGRADLPNYLRWQKTRYNYDAFGNRTSADVTYKNPDGTQTTRSGGSATYDARGRFATEQSNALGHIESRTFNKFGAVSSTVGPNGFLSASDFDAFGRKLNERSYAGSTASAALLSGSSALHQACSQTDALYGTAAACEGSEIYRTRTRTSVGSVSFSFYDKLQREVRTVAQAFNDNEWTTARITYDDRGRKASVSRPAGSGEVTVFYVYDELNRVVKETLRGGATDHVTETTYDHLTTTVTQKALAAEAGTADQSMSRTANSQGQTVSSLDALGNTTTFGYDAVGNLTSVTTAPAVADLAATVTESMAYDGRGRKISLSSKTAGDHQYTPNGLGELVRQQDARGWQTVMTYDVLGRLVDRREFESAATGWGTGATGTNAFVTQWTFDSATDCAPDGTASTAALRANSPTVGKLCAVTTAKGGSANTRELFVYDRLGRGVSTVTELDRSATSSADGKNGPRKFVNAVQYDANSRTKRVGYPGGVVTQNHFKAWSGSLNRVSDDSGATTHWTATSRYLDGQIAQMTVGGLVTGKSYDSLGRLDTITTAGGTVQNLDVTYNRFGNLVDRIDIPNGIATGGAKETYGYDAMNRLTTRNGATFASYDAIGNLKTLVGSGWGGTGLGTNVYTYDTDCKRLLSVTNAVTPENARALGSCIAGYDANGNVVNDGVRTAQYTAWNLPKTISRGPSSLSYEYDHSHGRVKEVSTAHGTTYYVGGYELVIPADSSAATPKLEERTFIATPAGTVGVITQRTSGTSPRTTDISYWHKDHLGSLVAITNQAGTVTQRFRFDAWGNRDCLLPGGGTTPCSASNTGGASGTGSEERGFTGHEMLDEVGLVHMNGRLFDAAIGRFTQADPVIQEPLNSQNYNRYSYVFNNPLVYTDPSGYSGWTKVRKPLAAVVAMIAVPWAAGQIMAMDYAAAMAAAVQAGEISSAAAVNMVADFAAAAAASPAALMAGGFAAGGISGGNIESAIMGAVQAGLSFGIGEATSKFDGATGPGGHAARFGSPAYAFNVMAHAALGCGVNTAAGGSCRSGAMAGGFSAAAGPLLDGLGTKSFEFGLAGRVAAGCLGARLGGGDCGVGALIGAFNYLYNECGQTRLCGVEDGGYGDSGWERVWREFGRLPSEMWKSMTDVDIYNSKSSSERLEGAVDLAAVLATRGRSTPQATQLRGRELVEAAAKLGYDRIARDPPFNPHGQKVFTNGKSYITPDADGHNGGAWKMFDLRGNRTGTYDKSLNRIGK